MTGGKRPERRPPPFSLRLSFEERAKLEARAGALPLASYIKSVVLDGDAPAYRQRRKPAEADQKLLAEVLACLGSTRLANNLNQLAKAANSGALYCDAATTAELTRACDDVRAMRLLLMQALGLKVEDHHRTPESTSQSFARAAAQPKRFAP